MTRNSSGLLEQFHALCERYAEGLPQRVSIIEAVWSRLALASSDETTRDTLRRLVHTLKGSGGTFGFPSITAAATTLENSLARGTLESAATSAYQWREVARHISELRRVAEDVGRCCAPTQA